MLHYRYWAFISYSSKDQYWAKWLQNALETYRIPRQLVGHQMPIEETTPKRFHPIFRDRDELPSSSNLSKELEEALRASRYLVVICSPNSAASYWVNREIETFCALGRDNRIFSLIIDGEPNSEKETECFPVALRRRQPLAADIRHHKDGKRDSKLKLLAGMLGVGLDELKQRDAQRRIRNLQIWLAVVTMVSVLIISLGLYAYDQRTKAYVAQVESAKTMTDPIDLIDFLLVDLHHTLESSGQTSVVNKVDDEIIQFLRKQDEWQGYSVSGILLEAVYKTHMQSGDEYFAQQQLCEALEEYQNALDVLDWSDNAKLPFDSTEGRIKIHQEISNVLVKQGNLEAAFNEYDKVLVIVQSLNAKDPADKDILEQLWSAYEHSGDLLVVMGKPEDALVQYQKALDAALGAVESYQEDDGWSARDVLVIHVRIGDTLLLKREFSKALMEYEAALNVAQNLINEEQSAISPVARVLGLDSASERPWHEDHDMIQQRIDHAAQLEGISHQFVGIQVNTLTPESAQELNSNPNLLHVLPKVEGILVIQVWPDSPAAKGDLRYGDVITAVNDVPVTNAEQIKQILEEHYRTGGDLKFTIQRLEETIVVSIEADN